MSGSTLKRLLPALLGGVGLSSVSAMAASLTPLNPVISGSTYVYALSGDAKTAGGSSTNLVGNPGPAAWGYGAAPTTTGVWLQNSTIGGQTQAVSNDGSTYAVFLPGSNDSDVVKDGKLHALYAVDGSLVGTQQAMGLSGTGQLVVGQNANSAAYWTYLGSAAGFGNATLMPTLAGNSLAYAVSLDGTIAVGRSTDANGLQHAVVWSGAGFGTIESLHPGPPYFSSNAFAISDDASTIVGYIADVTGETASLWTGPGYGTLSLIAPAGSSDSRALAVNADGTVVGGRYELSADPGNYHAFLKTDGNQSADLNDLLTAVGVDMTGIVLYNVTGLSDDGQYIASNDVDAGQAYVVFYNGEIGGVTSGAAQLVSLTGVADQRAALVTQPGAYKSVLLGDLNASDGGTELSAFGLYGSAAGGIKGTTTVGNLSVNAGVMLGTGDYGTVAYDGGLAAASLRYDFGTGDTGLNPFVEAGASFGRLQNLTFRRSYANGAGTATGIGITDGFIASTFARLGVEADLTADDEITLLAEIGQHWLSTSAYSEAQSATNPFPGHFAAATDSSTSAEAAASWTHRFEDTADFTLRAAVGTTFAGSSDLVASTAGAGTQAVTPVGGLYAEAGLHLGWVVSDSTRLDLYASGTTGERIGTAGHVGAGLSVGF